MQTANNSLTGLSRSWSTMWLVKEVLLNLIRCQYSELFAYARQCQASIYHSTVYIVVKHCFREKKFDKHILSDFDVWY